MPLPARSAAAVFAAALLLSTPGCGPDEAGQSVAARGGTASTVAGPAGTAPEGAPNVLLVVIDTLRADHLDLYGYERETAPRLAELAAGGVTFDRAVSQAPTTVPSHATMFTGRYPRQHMTVSYRTPLPPAEVTLAELFGAHGWRTFGVAASERFDPDSGFRQGFETFDLMLERSDAKRSAEVSRVTRQRLDSDDERPFFGFVHYMEPHASYDPPPWLATRFHPGLDELPPVMTGKYLRDHVEPDADVPAGIVDWLEALYDAEILSLDGQLGELFDALDELGLADDTLVVLTSDHGEEFKEHGLFLHHQLHVEVLEVPLVFRWPARLPAGVRLERPVELAGLLPTLTDLLSLPTPDGVSGRSFAGHLLPEGARPRAERETRHEVLDRMDVVLSEAGDDRWAVSATLPTGRFKLLNGRGDRLRLYQLDHDPDELQDVRWAYPREVGVLTELAASIAPGGEEWEGVERAPDAAAREWLIELGYVEETR
jgi:arylsulfatase A-like enzyme